MYSCDCYKQRWPKNDKSNVERSKRTRKPLKDKSAVEKARRNIKFRS